MEPDDTLELDARLAALRGLETAGLNAADLAARLADPQTPVWVLTDAHGLVRSVVPRETILAAVDATRRP